MIEYVPLEKCRIDERFMMRLDYNVDSLAENIRANGQLQPGMGYRGDNGYVMVYIGIRRLLAIRRLHELYGAPDAYYVTIIDEAPAANKMWQQAISENEERHSLSMLDKLNVVGKVPVAELANAIDKNIIKKLIDIGKAIGQDGMVDWLHMERMAGGNLTLAQMEALVSHLPDRRSRDVGAYIVVKAHYVSSAALGDNLPRLVNFFPLADAPEVAEYLKAHGVLKPEDTAPEIKAKPGPMPVKGLNAKMSNPQDFMRPVQHRGEAGGEAEEKVEEEAEENIQENAEVEENLPAVLVDPNMKEGQIYTCPACGKKARLIIIHA